MTAGAAFDSLADRYDDLWTNQTAGRLQREAVWHHLASRYQPGETILDMGCGTGEDALHMQRAGIHVRAFDISPAMVRITCARGVDACVMSIEELDRFDGAFDGAISNFGALNCVGNLEKPGASLARLIRPGGWLSLCLMGRFCLWETAYFLGRGKLRKAMRRWTGLSESTSLGLRIYYPTVRAICRALAPDFTLVQAAGVGLFVPPSYVGGLSNRVAAACAEADRRLAHLPGLRALSDHRLLIFSRR